MKVRTVRPGLFASGSLAQTSLPARFTFVGLLCVADDEGRFLASAKQLAGDIYPHDPDVSFREVENWLQELVAVESVVLFEAKGVRYGVLPGFREHQRISKSTPSRLPAPPSRDSQGFPGIPTPVVEVEVEVERDFTEPDGFAAFWEAYPRKVGKRKARDAYTTALRRAPAAVILRGAETYRDDSHREPGFTAHPTTWLNRDGWDDEAIPANDGKTDELERARQDRIAEAKRLAESTRGKP